MCASFLLWQFSIYVSFSRFVPSLAESTLILACSLTPGARLMSIGCNDFPFGDFRYSAEDTLHILIAINHDHIFHIHDQRTQGKFRWKTS